MGWPPAAWRPVRSNKTEPLYATLGYCRSCPAPAKQTRANKIGISIRMFGQPPHHNRRSSSTLLILRGCNGALKFPHDEERDTGNVGNKGGGGVGAGNKVGARGNAPGDMCHTKARGWGQQARQGVWVTMKAKPKGLLNKLQELWVLPPAPPRTRACFQDLSGILESSENLSQKPWNAQTRWYKYIWCIILYRLGERLQTHLVGVASQNVLRWEGY